MKTNKILLIVYVIIAIAVIHQYFSHHSVPSKPGQELVIPEPDIEIPSNFLDFNSSLLVENLVAYNASNRMSIADYYFPNYNEYINSDLED